MKRREEEESVPPPPPPLLPHATTRASGPGETASSQPWALRVVSFPLRPGPARTTRARSPLRRGEIVLSDSGLAFTGMRALTAHEQYRYVLPPLALVLFSIAALAGASNLRGGAPGWMTLPVFVASLVQIAGVIVAGTRTVPDEQQIPWSAVESVTYHEAGRWVVLRYRATSGGAARPRLLDLSLNLGDRHLLGEFLAQARASLPDRVAHVPATDFLTRPLDARGTATAVAVILALLVLGILLGRL